MADCQIEIKGLPVLDNCPSLNEQVLFFGSDTTTGMSLRTWAKLLQCFISPPIAGVVGGTGMPPADSPTWASSKLIGLGNANNGNVSFDMAGSILYNYGDIASFELDNVNGIMTLLFGNTFQAGDPLNINTNQ